MEIRTSGAQKQPIADQALVAPAVAESDKVGGEQPDEAKFEERREDVEERLIGEAQKAAAPAVEREYQYEMREEVLPAERSLESPEGGARSPTKEDFGEHAAPMAKGEQHEYLWDTAEGKLSTEPKEIREEGGRQEEGDEAELEKEPSLGDKIFGFAKKAGMVAGGAVAAPVALAATGALAAYDAISKHRTEDEEPKLYPEGEDVFKKELSPKEEPDQKTRIDVVPSETQPAEIRQKEEALATEVEEGATLDVEDEYHLGFREYHDRDMDMTQDVILSEELTREEQLAESEASFPRAKEYEYHYEIREEISPSREQKEPFLEEAPISGEHITGEREEPVAAPTERAPEMYEVEEDLIPREQLSRDEELVESTASFPPVKQYEYRYEEEVSPSREQKEPFVEEAPVSSTAPEAEKLAEEEPREGQFEERPRDEREGVVGETYIEGAPAAEYKYRYEISDEHITAEREEPVAAPTERAPEMYEVEEDLIPHEQLSRDAELVGSTASFPPVKQYEYRHDEGLEIRTSGAQKQPIADQALVAPAVAESDKVGGEQPDEAKFEERREDVEERLIGEAQKAAAPAVEREYQYEMREEVLPAERSLESPEGGARSPTKEDFGEHAAPMAKGEQHEYLWDTAEGKLSTEPKEIREEGGRQEEGDEAELEKEPSLGDKIFGFAKKAGMVAGGAVAAPVALAATGALAAYDAISKHRTEDEEPKLYPEGEDVFKKELSPKEEPDQKTRIDVVPSETQPAEIRQKEEALATEVEEGATLDVEDEYHLGFREYHDRDMDMTQDVILSEELTREEQLAESEASFPRAKEYEYHYEIREEI
ncbi:unnamed protein product, partial [Toxocara canis]